MRVHLPAQFHDENAEKYGVLKFMQKKYYIIYRITSTKARVYETIKIKHDYLKNA